MYEQERQQLLDAVAQFMLQTGCAYFAIPADELMRGTMLAFGDAKFVQDQIEHLTAASDVPNAPPLVFTRRGIELGQ